MSMLEIGDLNEPVSYRYEMQTPWGLVAQDISVDIRILIQHPGSIPAIGRQIWLGGIATAISRDVSLSALWYVRWRAAPLSFPGMTTLFDRGRQGGTPAGKAHTAIVMMHTGHADNKAARGLYLPSTPLSWQSGGMLTSRGWDALLSWAQGFKMGLAGSELGGDIQHVIAYPGIVPATVDNLGGVLFRRVTHLKVLQYTDKAPDFQGGLWP